MFSTTVAAFYRKATFIYQVENDFSKEETVDRERRDATVMTDKGSRGHLVKLRYTTCHRPTAKLGKTKGLVECIFGGPDGKRKKG